MSWYKDPDWWSAIGQWAGAIGTVLAVYVGFRQVKVVLKQTEESKQIAMLQMNEQRELALRQLEEQRKMTAAASEPRIAIRPVIEEHEFGKQKYRILLVTITNIGVVPINLVECTIGTSYFFEGKPNVYDPFPILLPPGELINFSMQMFELHDFHITKDKLTSAQMKFAQARTNLDSPYTSLQSKCNGTISWEFDITIQDSIGNTFVELIDLRMVAWPAHRPKFKYHCRNTNPSIDFELDCEHLFTEKEVVQNDLLVGIQTEEYKQVSINV
ncbi:hypothetical protein [Baia soyae]|uniref:Uncharacterized protein n=1 Tax=Baia soyae TaxID=1544746 RepID=A0A4R2S150_9BACL|nr:hypothetical protein [Baia soyae]TCP69725.1 hypothetical protein EDD57_10640 [Baia soyae]